MNIYRPIVRNAPGNIHETVELVLKDDHTGESFTLKLSPSGAVDLAHQLVNAALLAAMDG